jgi:CRISPR-associated endonuclease/helicase Cas3
MLRSDDGGYEVDKGWTGEKGRTDPVVHSDGIPEDDNDSDRLVFGREWQTIAEHTDRVVAEVDRLIAGIGLEESVRTELLTAARWHDVGKAHPVFQGALPKPSPDDSKLWGKSKGGKLNYKGRHFRHELASAIAMLLNSQSDLAAYLAASHHGKVRLSIRSLPNEKMPEDDSIRFARGLWDGDPLPAADLGNGVVMPPTAMSLSYMELGDDDVTGPSWLARVLSLRDKHGPFALAFLEAVIRIADWRASIPKENGIGEVRHV